MQQHHIPRVSDVPGVCTMYVCGVASLSRGEKKRGRWGAGRGRREEDGSYSTTVWDGIDGCFGLGGWR